MTTPASNADLKARAVDLWRDAISGHPNEDALRRGDLLGRVIEPAVDAWQQASPGDQQMLAAATVGWRFGYQLNVQAGIERAASTVADDLRQARDRIASHRAGTAALTSAARQVGLDPDDPNYDLKLHALADALALSGVDLAAQDRQRRRDLTKIVQIAREVARSAHAAPVRREPALPDTIAADVLATERATAPVEPVRRLFGALGLGWHAGMVIGEDVGAVYAVHRIAAVTAQTPRLRVGPMTPAQWTKHALRPVRSRLEQRLGAQAADRLWTDAVRATRDPSMAYGSAPRLDDLTRSPVGSAFGPLTTVDPARAGPTSPPASSADSATPTRHRRR